MIICIILIISLLLSFLTAYLAKISYWWVIGLFAAYDIGLAALFFLFAIAVSLFVKKQPPKAEKRAPNKFYRWIMVQSYSIALKFMRVRVTVSGRKNVPPKGTTFMIASNHLSNYDHMTIITRLKKHKIAFISKPENFSIPVVGRYLQSCAFLPIDRGDAGKAMTTFRAAGEAMKEDLLCYGVFPEGTRSRTGELLPFHDCSFLPAKKAGVPILVVHMSGSRAIKKRAPWLPTRVHMDILGCLDGEFVKTHSAREISEAVRAMMEACEHKEIADVNVQKYGGAVKSLQSDKKI